MRYCVVFGSFRSLGPLNEWLHQVRIGLGKYHGLYCMERALPKEFCDVGRRYLTSVDERMKKSELRKQWILARKD